MYSGTGATISVTIDLGRNYDVVEIQIDFHLLANNTFQMFVKPEDDTNNNFVTIALLMKIGLLECKF